jgi:hypothetical protein
MSDPVSGTTTWTARPSSAGIGSLGAPASLSASDCWIREMSSAIAARSASVTVPPFRV